VAAQVIEDAETRLPRRPCGYHAVPKRLFGKARGAMTQGGSIHQTSADGACLASNNVYASAYDSGCFDR